MSPLARLLSARGARPSTLCAGRPLPQLLGITRAPGRARAAAGCAGVGAPAASAEPAAEAVAGVVTSFSARGEALVRIAGAAGPQLVALPAALLLVRGQHVQVGQDKAGSWVFRGSLAGKAAGATDFVPWNNRAGKASKGKLKKGAFDVGRARSSTGI